MRHTKIIATVGPASSDSAVLDELIAAGVDVLRLNFSHGTQADHAAAFDRIRAAWTEKGMTPRPYAAGTWGPSAAIALTERDGISWHE